MHYLAIRRGGASAVSSKCIREEYLLLINFALILTKKIALWPWRSTPTKTPDSLAPFASRPPK